MKFATIFSGGEGAGVGAAMAGADHLWGIEYDDQIAACARANGFNVLTTDARTAPWAELDRPDWLHMSPPCTRASRANQQGKESDLDMELAEACLLAVDTLRPEAISVENVRDYGKFKAYERLRSGLAAMGYTLAESVLNAADYGTPQTRERLFIIGRRSAHVTIPAPTHSQDGAPESQLSMLAGGLPPWRGWYGAMADLIPDMPILDLSDWAQRRLAAQKVIPDIYYLPGNNSKARPVWTHEPLQTIMASASAMQGGRIVVNGIARQITTRALARCNGLADSYQLPEARIAYAIIGNMVMPDVMAAIIRANPL